MRISPVMKAYFAVLAAVFVAGAFLAFRIGGGTPLFDETAEAFNHGWSYVDMQGREQTLTLPTNLDWPAGQALTLTHRIPDDCAEGDTICLRSSQQSIWVLVDGTEVYRYGDEEDLAGGKSPGSAYHLIRLSEKDRGKLLTVVLLSPYARFAGIVNQALIGSKTACIHSIIRWRLPNLILCAAIGLTGLIITGIYLAASFGGRRYPVLLYLGIFAMVISRETVVSSSTESTSIPCSL